MKFSINKEDLLSNLQLVAKAAPARSTLPIINSALFTVNGNQLITISFYTFNIIVDTWQKKEYVELH